MDTPQHDAAAHSLDALLTVPDAPGRRAPGCAQCAAEHRAEGRRLALALLTALVLGLLALSLGGTAGRTLSLLVLLGVVIPVPPLSRWLGTGTWRRERGERG